MFVWLYCLFIDIVHFHNIYLFWSKMLYFFNIFLISVYNFFFMIFQNFKNELKYFSIMKYFVFKKIFFYRIKFCS